MCQNSCVLDCWDKFGSDCISSYTLIFVCRIISLNQGHHWIFISTLFICICLLACVAECMCSCLLRQSVHSDLSTLDAGDISWRQYSALFEAILRRQVRVQGPNKRNAQILLPQPIFFTRASLLQHSRGTHSQRTGRSKRWSVSSSVSLCILHFAPCLIHLHVAHLQSISTRLMPRLLSWGSHWSLLP